MEEEEAEGEVGRVERWGGEKDGLYTEDMRRWGGGGWKGLRCQLLCLLFK